MWNRKAFSPNVAFLAILFAFAITTIIVLFGRALSSQWEIIWSSVASITGALALAAFITTAYYAKLLVDETKRVDAVRLANEALNSPYVERAFAALGDLITEQGDFDKARLHVTAYCQSLQEPLGFCRDLKLELQLRTMSAAWRYISLLYAEEAIDRGIAVKAGYYSVLHFVYALESWIIYESNIGLESENYWLYTRHCFAYVRSHDKLANIYPFLRFWSPFPTSAVIKA